MGRCVLLNFKLPQSISDLELRALLTHPRLMFYLGLAQCHVWAVTGHSSCAGLGGSCLQLCLGWQIPAGVLWWGKVWVNSGLWICQIQGSSQAAHQYCGFRCPTNHRTVWVGREIQGFRPCTRPGCSPCFKSWQPQLFLIFYTCLLGYMMAPSFFRVLESVILWLLWMPLLAYANISLHLQPLLRTENNFQAKVLWGSHRSHFSIRNPARIFPSSIHAFQNKLITPTWHKRSLFPVDLYVNKRCNTEGSNFPCKL